MKTKIISIFLSVLGSLLFWSCNEEDFLDRKPIDFLAPDNFQTEKDIREAVNGIYAAYISDNYEPIMSEFFTDNGFYVGYIDLWNRNFNSETSFVETKWSRDYKIILRANTVLHYIDNVDLSEAQYNQYKGEALFLRALAYFDLSEFYGGVPLRTKPESLAEANKPITPLSEIVEFVLNDLETASELLPASYDATDKGRATKGAAWAMKARVLLYNKYYEETVEYCRKVKQLNKYSINKEYPSMFYTSGENENTETIFDMQFEQDQASFGLSNNWTTVFKNWGGYQVLKNLEEEYYSANGLSISDPNNSLYDPTINKDIYKIANIRNGSRDNRFTNRDPRLNYTLVVPYAIYTIGINDGLPVPYYPYAQRNSNFTGFKCRKYVDLSDGNLNNISGVNPIIIRFADILLMEAEALVELGSYDESYVADLVNQVRQRPDVMMPKIEEVEGTGLTQDEMRQIIRHERRVEFAFEGLRIFDIKRWDIGTEAYSDGRGYEPSILTNSSANYVEYVYQTRTFDPNKGYLWPIPKSEADSNNAIKDVADNE